MFRLLKQCRHDRIAHRVSNQFEGLGLYSSQNLFKLFRSSVVIVIIYYCSKQVYTYSKTIVPNILLLLYRRKVITV